MPQSEAGPAASRSTTQAQAPSQTPGQTVRGLAEQASKAADADASLQGAHLVLDSLTEMSRIGQEGLESMMAAQQALASALNETGQRMANLASETVKDSLDQVNALSDTRSASDLVTLQLALWKRSADRTIDETKALSDIALRTAELTLGSWAVAFDRLTTTRR